MLALLLRAAWVGYGAMRIGVSMEVGAMRSKIVSLLAVTFSLGFAQAASAADMPTKAPIVNAPVAVPFSWTGFYVGVDAGYHWNKVGIFNPATPA